MTAMSIRARDIQLTIHNIPGFILVFRLVFLKFKFIRLWGTASKPQGIRKAAHGRTATVFKATSRLQVLHRCRRPGCAG